MAGTGTADGTPLGGFFEEINTGALPNTETPVFETGSALDAAPVFDIIVILHLNVKRCSLHYQSETIEYGQKTWGTLSERAPYFISCSSSSNSGVEKNSPSVRLREALMDLIETQGVDVFYVGNHGDFNRMTRSLLRELSAQHPHIRYAVVLAYVTQKRDEFDHLNCSDPMLPEGIKRVPLHFAILWRNKWMIKQSEYVVTHITHFWGGAAQFAEIAERQKKKVVSLT